VRRALISALERLIVLGEDAAFFAVCYLDAPGSQDERSRVWTEVSRQVREAFPDQHAAWHRDRPWSRAHPLSDLHSVVTRHGVEPLYLSEIVYGLWVLPQAVAMVGGTDEDTGGVHDLAHELRERLLRSATPWMPGDRWLRADFDGRGPLVLENLKNRAWPPSGEDLATFLVVCLPYLELCRRLPHTGAWFPSDIANKLTSSRTYLSLRDELLRVGVPRDVVEFLMRWRAGKFRVLGD
jgi:hypothetical protein